MGKVIRFTSKNRPKQVYRIKLTLLDSEPEIWRTILLLSNTSLDDLHKIIQTTMGWTNSHLHQFIHNNNFYCNRESESDWDEERFIDYSNFSIEHFLKKVGHKLIYVYDFGDDWRHELQLEEILPLSGTPKLPVCLDGERKCPPDDCGGIWGYENLLKIIANPRHEEHQSMIVWLGEPFDPEKFDMKKINALLKKKDFGCILL